MSTEPEPEPGPKPLPPTVWVCAACGRVGESRWTVGDESCGMHAVECWRSSVRGDPNQGNLSATVVGQIHWVEPQMFASPQDIRVERFK